MKDHAQAHALKGEIGDGWLFRILLNHDGLLTILQKSRR